MMANILNKEIDYAAEMRLSAEDKNKLTDLAIKLRKTMIDGMFHASRRFDADEAVRELLKDLEKQKEKVAMELMGLSIRWKQVEFDHCNGRMSTIDAKMKEILGPIIDPWIRGMVEEVVNDLMAKPRQQYVNAIKKEIRSYVLGYKMTREAETAGANMLQEYIKIAIKELKDEIEQGEKKSETPAS